MDVIFHMLDCSVSKRSGFNLPFVVTAHLLSSRWISIFCLCSLSKSSECCFQCFITANLISSGCVSINVANVVTLNNGYGFPCVVTGYLISSEWIFICHCCFTWKCMWFFTCFHCSLSKSSGCGFLSVRHLIRMG